MGGIIQIATKENKKRYDNFEENILRFMEAMRPAVEAFTDFMEAWKEFWDF